MGITDLVKAWNCAGNCIPEHRLSLYAEALVGRLVLGPYRSLNDEQEDGALLALYRVDRPRATFEDIHQLPPLALSRYQQLLWDLARLGFGPVKEKTSQ
jgi:hypothetical protein